MDLGTPFPWGLCDDGGCVDDVGGAGGYFWERGLR